jgi:single-strand DNA-binding protein
MPSLNQVFLMGNVTRDPQLRQLPSQTVVAEFGLACNRKYRTADGEEREDVCFVDCTAFGKQAEVISQYCQKGKPIFVQGRLRYDSWDDKQSGAKRSKLTVVVEQFQFVGGRDGQGSYPGAAAETDKGESRPTPSRDDKPGDRPRDNKLRAKRPALQQADIPF